MERSAAQPLEDVLSLWAEQATDLAHEDGVLARDRLHGAPVERVGAIERLVQRQPHGAGPRHILARALADEIDRCAEDALLIALRREVSLDRGAHGSRILDGARRLFVERASKDLEGLRRRSVR